MISLNNAVYPCLALHVKRLNGYDVSKLPTAILYKQTIQEAITDNGQPVYQIPFIPIYHGM